jgi:hypothetical protein
VANPTIEGIGSKVSKLLIFPNTILHHMTDLYSELEQGQLSFLTKNNFFPPLVSTLEPNSDSCRLSEVSEEHDSMGERATSDHKLLTPNKAVRHISTMVRVLYYGLCELSLSGSFTLQWTV